MLTFLLILGSLGLFIYGMKVMSEGLQKASGSKLRAMTHNLAKTPARGVISGALMTTIVQSSSASTVIMVSFVNAGLLNLRQAISMIMGANLGTTTTFWLIALIGFKFNLSAVALPAVGFGVVCLFMRNAKVREVGETLIGFGILFLGLNLLKEAVPDVQSNMELFETLSAFKGYGYFSVLIFFFFGIILTIAVQSSSVAGAITLTMVAKGWIDYELAAAVVLGENVGTTITANLAAMAGNTEAKRAARAHLVFNLIGVLWMLPVFYFYLDFVGWITDFLTLSGRGTTEVKLAVFHTLFNLINTGLLIAFIPQLARFSTRLVKQVGAEPERNRFVLNSRNLGENLPRTGEILLGEAQRGVGQMNEITHKMFLAFLDMYANPDETLPIRAKAIKGMLTDGAQMADDISE